jgi:hypothetical protein
MREPAEGMDPVAAVSQEHRVTVTELLRHRRAVRDHREALAANDALFDAARDLRRRAQQQINAGRPDLAVPYLDEVELFESAVQAVPGL